MPHLIVYRRSGDENDVRLLGICEYKKRDEFEQKVESLCKAYGWSMDEIHWKHCYDNFIINDFHT